MADCKDEGSAIPCRGLSYYAKKSRIRLRSLRRWIMFLVVLTMFISAVPPAQAATVNSASLSGFQVFPKDHVWNTPVDTLPVDARSTNYVTTIGSARSLSY